MDGVSGIIGAATVTGNDSKWTNSSNLYVGQSGNGTLTIEAGGQVSDTFCMLGQAFGSAGTATVIGTNSKWANSADLYVAYSGSGSVTVDAGGSVSNAIGYLGYSSGSTGIITVTGTGSKWTNSGGLYVGKSGSGSLNLRGNGNVSASSTTINSSSLLSLDVGYGSLLTVGNGTGTITNSGKVRDCGRAPGHGRQSISAHRRGNLERERFVRSARWNMEHNQP